MWNTSYRSHRFAGLVFMFVLYASSLGASPLSDSSLKKLLSVSGIEQQTRDLSNATQQALNQLPKASVSDPTLSTAVDTLTLHVTNAEKLLSGIRQQLNNQINEAEAQQLIAWFDSPLGKKISAARSAVSRNEGLYQPDRSAYLRNAPKDRIAQIERLISESNMVEHAASLQASVGKAVAVASLLPKLRKRFKLEALETQIEAQKSHMKQLLRQQLSQSTLYAYRELSDAELAEQIAQLDTPLMQRYHLAVTTGAIQEIESAIATATRY